MVNKCPTKEFYAYSYAMQPLGSQIFRYDCSSLTSKITILHCAMFLKQEELTSQLKHDIERHWRYKLVKKKFDPTKPEDKFYVLSICFHIHRVIFIWAMSECTISDAMARFYRMNGKNVKIIVLVDGRK